MNVFNKIREFNPDIFITFTIMMLVFRLKRVFNIPVNLFKGLNIVLPFQTKLGSIQLADSPNPNQSEEDTFLNKQLQKLQLFVVKLNPKLTIQSNFLTTLPLFLHFESMINLCVSNLISHGILMTFYCWNPFSPFSSWSLGLNFLAIVFPLYNLFQVIALTSSKSKEAQYAYGLGAIVLLTTFLSFLLPDWFTIFDFSILTHLYQITKHLQAVSGHLVEDKGEVDATLLIFNLSKLAFSAFAGLLCSMLVIPAIRFSHTFLEMTIGKKHERTDLFSQGLLAFDLFLSPLIVLLLYSGLLYTSSSVSLPCPSSTCPVPSFTQQIFSARFPLLSPVLPPLSPQTFLSLQLGSVLALCALKLSLYRKYLQRFLDVAVRLISVQIAVGITPQGTNELHKKITVRSQYLVASALQFFSSPTLLLSAVLLIHRLSPLGTGTCVSSLSFLSSHQLMDTNTSQTFLEQISSLQTESRSFDATAFALQTRSGPYLWNVFRNLFVPVRSGEEDQYTPLAAASVLRMLLRRLATLQLLPGPVAREGLVMLVCGWSLFSFLLAFFGLLYWRIHPMAFQMASGGTVFAPPRPETEPSSADDKKENSE